MDDDTEYVKNQPFDEALDVSRDSAEILSPERQMQSANERRVSNQNFDELIEVSQTTDGEDTPRSEESSNDCTDKSASFLSNGKDNSHIMEEKNNIIKNEHFDSVVNVEDSEDESSIETRASMSSICSKRRKDLKEDTVSFKLEHITSEQPKPLALKLSSKNKSKQQRAISTSDEESASGLSGSSSDGSRSHNNFPRHSSNIEGAYNPSDYNDLDVSDDVKELFLYIQRYKPHEIELETTLKCFIPSYIPAIGEPDAFLKMPRPDGMKDGLGMRVIDEPSATQSDAAVIELQLRASSKKKLVGEMIVRSIENAAKSPIEVEGWIESISQLHRSKPPPQVIYKRSDMPDVDQLMEAWSEDDEIHSALSSEESGLGVSVAALPDINLDMSVQEYAKVVYVILGIPFDEGMMNQSVHALFTLFTEFQNNQHFSSSDNNPPMYNMDGFEKVDAF
eukprot:CAMPEP_0171327146 /NCGR_PEP_ID=MMETSP0816-20121228/117893_1 /TAXON_ID=420281 /ORGANISM="Proboscia inermis, Strain CCAP1064/1" /LENGTH=449 /DNA_ID=CAMNT_0011826789 /DNA_START=477 /DNA_END=1826 /DNA_ORIENTATION=-